VLVLDVGRLDGPGEKLGQVGRAYVCSKGLARTSPVVGVEVYVELSGSNGS
jgi:hypothetical protein